MQAVSTLSKKGFETKKSFPDGGYYIIGDAFGTTDEVKCIIDCGPTGYLTLAAHGHADALALYLTVGGTEFLIDPGTYNYHGKNEWREYFKGTSAHNTVRIDHSDQSLSGGKFMWIHRANAQASIVDFTSDKDEFEGYHDGYRRLGDPVTHRRKVIFRKAQKNISVIDTIECLKDHVC